MEKKELKKQLDEVVVQIKNNSKDAKFADALVDKLLSLKGQMMIEPTRIHIEEKDVVKEYDNDAVRFVRCKDCIIFQAKGGLSVVVKPTMAALFEHLTVLLDMKDRYEELDEEGKKSYELLYSATVWMLEVPIFATCDDEMFFGVVNDVLARFNKFTETELNKDLQEETPKEDADFENMNEVLMGEKNDRSVG